ncbi:MAG: DUF6092 family protein [Thermoplasmatota archaeon]
MNEDPFYDLFCYMASSARGLIDEPEEYGPLRLIESIERLVDILDEEELIENQEIYLKIREEIEEKKYSVMSDMDEFTELLDDIVVELAKEAPEE